MKKEYVTPVAMFLRYRSEDVITASYFEGTNEDDDNTKCWGEIF